MDRWEYMSHTTRYSESATLATFNILGARGWELCGFADGFAWFKRNIIKRNLAEQGGAVLSDLADLAEGGK